MGTSSTCFIAVLHAVPGHGGDRPEGAHRPDLGLLGRLFETGPPTGEMACLETVHAYKELTQVAPLAIYRC